MEQSRLKLDADAVARLFEKSYAQKQALAQILHQLKPQPSDTLLLVNVNPAVYEQLKDTESLKVLGAENVFVTSQPGTSSQAAYEKAQQLIHP